MMFCASARSRPDLTVSTLMPFSLIAFSMPPPRATAKLASGISRGLKTTSPSFSPNFSIMRLAKLVAGGKFVHADIGLTAVALGALEVVIVETDDDDARLDGSADAGVESIRAGNRNGDTVDAGCGRALDQVVLADRIVVGILHVEIDAELCRGVLRAFYDGIEELDARVEIDDHRCLDVGGHGRGRQHCCGTAPSAAALSFRTVHLHDPPIGMCNRVLRPDPRLAVSVQRSASRDFLLNRCLAG